MVTRTGAVLMTARPGPRGPGGPTGWGTWPVMWPRHVWRGRASAAMRCMHRDDNSRRGLLQTSSISGGFILWSFFQKPLFWNNVFVLVLRSRPSQPADY